MKRNLTILLLCCAAWASAARLVQPGGEINPYVDDKIVHYGFSVGLNFMSFGVQPSLEPIEVKGNMETIEANVTSMMPGFSVGFIFDVRLCKMLNLRFTPALNFGTRTIVYKTKSGRDLVDINGNKNQVDVLAMPIDVPLYLKFSAFRERNYRPYVIAGGGFSYNVSRDKSKPVLLKGPDWFVGVGGGCDIYLRWFKLCPEIRYQAGFNNILCPAGDNDQLAPQDKVFTESITRLLHQQITLTFNFE